MARIVLTKAEREALRWLLNATDGGRVISGSGDYPAHVGNLTVLLGRIRLADGGRG